MIGKKYILLVALITVVLIVTGTIYFYTFKKVQPVLNPSVISYNLNPMDQSPTYLYFLDKENSYLTSEKRSSLHSSDPAQFGRNIVQAVIDGPKEGLMPTIPKETKLRALYLDENGTAYVDLTENLQSNHPGGSMLEYFTIFSIANSLILNVTQIETVKFLKGGCEALTLAGHIDIRLPFKANMLLVR